MPIAVTEFEKKEYTIAGSVFRLKKPTLGIKRRGFILATILSVKAQELENAVETLGDVDKIDKTDISALEKLCKDAERTTEIYNEIFVKGEELVKLVLEPIKAGDENKLVADNIDEFIIRQVASDFFTIAGPLTTPAKN